MATIRPIHFVVLILAVFWQGTASGGDGILDTLAPDHPRLILTEDALQYRKAQAQTDEVLQGFVRAAIRRADDCLDDPKLEYRKRGPRLLHISKACVDRIYELGIA
ncbi:hypothetical protein [Allorhodopirellula solitaria]|uniref:Uncharacterized protein n=1 Tax=Allorhodopirellula solitaria TaxID=2527987 RepID=A0A5C5WPV0_9BACT|nr:hypothetical protein [Allorhodopirellula solitaria]TWT52151.1 hypothetical protein CA85_50650 [Allorhodopirellula solitaria]